MIGGDKRPQAERAACQDDVLHRGLRTILFASAGMVVSMTAFLLTQDEIGLYSVSAVFGLAFGGLIPGYILAVR